MCSCDFDLPEVAQKVTRRARKDYECHECCRVIAKGELYERHTNLYESGWTTYFWCLHCATAKPIASDLSGCHCWLYTNLWEGFRDHSIEGDGGKALARLVVMAERKWTVRRGPRKGQLMPVPQVPVTA